MKRKTKFYLMALMILVAVIYTSPIGKRSDRISVTLAGCVDGDTADFWIDGESVRVRFLAIDTPEVSHGTGESEPFGEQAAEYTCSYLKAADKIELEMDSNASEYDKYGRMLAWVFADGKLLQKEILLNGLANVAYLYDDYKYTEQCQSAQKKAEREHLGIFAKD